MTKLPTLYLRRYLSSKNLENLNCILGKVYDESFNKVCVSLERPDLNNQKNASCIPAGIYKCSPDNTGKFQYFKIENVPERSNIELHQGNKVEDSKGCPLLGEKWAIVNCNGFITNSKKTLNLLRNNYPEGFILFILEEYI